MHRHALNKLEVKNIICQCDRYLCFPTDIWTPMSKRGYIVITDHITDNGGTIRHPGPPLVRILSLHKAEQLAQHFCEALRGMNTPEELWTATSANASTNLAMMSVLKNRLNNDHALTLS